ncbi:hypothetical protein [Telluribacter humicola]|uniref:hypothetical protein n=1 Tax=Telluribacter humicola TaxID=1720261 RepID=UPI001A97586E|nr:hypothetical protein [Telluribacter humicola]
MIIELEVEKNGRKTEEVPEIKAKVDFLQNISGQLLSDSLYDKQMLLKVRDRQIIPERYVPEPERE